MWTNVITGVLTIAALVIGALLEPLKGLLTAGGRTRQHRAEQAALVIQAASDSRHIAVELNAFYRHHIAGNRVDPEQQHRYITDYSRARNDLRKATGLLRLHGPDELADQASSLWRADCALFSVLQEPDDGPHELTKQPRRVQQASEALDSEIQAFAGLARKHTA